VLTRFTDRRHEPGAGEGLRDRSKFNALTGLRFLAALAVVVHHSVGRLLSTDTFAPWQLGGLAVSFFFVLSGFILTYSYPELPTSAEVRKFLWARFARVWPIHFLSLILSIVLISDILLVGKAPFIANLMAVHAWVPRGDYFFSFNAVSWSISVELGFYLIFPLLIRDLKATVALKLGLSLLLAGAVIAICAILDPHPFDMQHVGLSSTGLIYINPAARLFEFVLGMSAAALWQTHRKHIERGNVIAWTAIEGASITALILYFGYARGPIYRLIASEVSPYLAQWLFIVDMAPFFALLIVVSALGAGWIGRALGSTPMVLLGEISYSIYMLHYITIIFITRHGLISWVPDQLQFLVVAVLIVLMSTISYTLVESPARRTIVRLSRPPTR
jgi:peptidoglycan/LPS O-acetylase OafA/YrhL